jgi:flagellar FliL protein
MKSNVKIIAAFVIVAVLTGAIGAGAAWLGLRTRAGTAAQAAAASGAAKAPAATVAAAPAPVVDTRELKYVTLEKVIVMLRREATDPITHYMAIDLVFKTPVDEERTTKEHLPMLRSVAVKALSTYTFETASPMTIDQFAVEINRAFSESYAHEHREKPFSEAMIGKLIIE